MFYIKNIKVKKTKTNAFFNVLYVLVYPFVWMYHKYICIRFSLSIALASLLN